jgi:sterol desaturase/sphingolipid hydroxylase (fatty acid hydroxylase superfamily)
MPYFRRWKIQDVRVTYLDCRSFLFLGSYSLINKNKTVSNAQIWKCIKVVLLTHVTCEAPLILAFHPICAYFGMRTSEVPFSSPFLMAWQIALFFVFEGELSSDINSVCTTD